MAIEIAVANAVEGMTEPAAELALTYARFLDAHPELLPDLGPKLLVCLEALLLTPRARAAVKAVTTGERPPSPLDELRQRRGRRERGATDLDPAAS